MNNSTTPTVIVGGGFVGLFTALYLSHHNTVRGERLYDSCPRNRGSNISLIGALSVDGLIATMCLPGSVNTEVFFTYVREVLLPQLWRGALQSLSAQNAPSVACSVSCCIMDNLPVHKASKIREIIQTVGSEVVFLPPYSPDLSPIELCWSKLKQCLRSAKARTTKTINQALSEIINHHISNDDAVGWFEHCGLFI
ncbi:transposase [Myxosarcina sp. GI1]|uniref:transposase n=1 Tax=Myxosarcina sp. GI1 TaxID=1541065 RepID=UPI0009DD1980|nr:transposase [Myxosarcina sp. GI1]